MQGNENVRIKMCQIFAKLYVKQKSVQCVSLFNVPWKRLLLSTRLNLFVFPVFLSASFYKSLVVGVTFCRLVIVHFNAAPARLHHSLNLLVFSG